MKVFDLKGTSRLCDEEKPPLWECWSLVRKTRWLEDNGYAEHAFDAMEILKALGEWPEFEDAGHGPGLARTSESGHHQCPGWLKRQRRSKRTGRQDRLKDYY